MSSFANTLPGAALDPVSDRSGLTPWRSVTRHFAVRRAARLARTFVSRHGPGPGALALTVASALGACAGPATEQGRVDWLGRDEHRIVVTADPFSDAETVRVGFADRWQTEEYAFLKTGGRQLELVFAEASNSFTVALDYQMPIKTMVPTWNANAGVPAPPMVRVGVAESASSGAIV